MRVKLTVAYDGTHYLGWQKNIDGPSIEGALQLALEQILQHPVSLHAASRTDAGVHAKGQVVTFDIKKAFFDNKKFLKSINGLLPNDIAVTVLEEVSPEFDPSRDSLGKEYHYHLCFSKIQDPQQRFYSWHLPEELNLNEMRKSSQHLLGEHRFKAFANFKKHADPSDDMRRIQEISIQELPFHQIRFSLIGNHFLYKMVRNIVGTLVDVGRGRLSSKEIQEILASRDRTRAGVTAPAQGLTLFQVYY